MCRNDRRSPAPTIILKKIVSCVNRNENGGQGRVKVAEEAALPPDVRKASGFPGQTTSLVPLGSAGRLSLPAEPRELVRPEAVGKAKPFRTSGGRAALGCYVSGTLTRPSAPASLR